MRVAELIEKELNRCKNESCIFDLSRVFYSDSFTHAQNPPDFTRNKIPAVTPAQHKKLRLYVLNSLRLKGWSRKQMAQLFAVTPRTIGNWLNDLKKEYKENAGDISAVEFTGDTIAFYDEMRAEAMRLANSPHIALNGRLKAINAALQAESSKHVFLERVGFFEGMSVKPCDSGIRERLKGVC